MVIPTDMNSIVLTLVGAAILYGLQRLGFRPLLPPQPKPNDPAPGPNPVPPPAPTPDPLPELSKLLLSIIKPLLDRLDNLLRVNEQMNQELRVRNEIQQFMTEQEEKKKTIPFPPKDHA